MGNELSVNTEKAAGTPSARLRHFTPRSLRGQATPGGSAKTPSHDVKKGDAFELWQNVPAKELAFRVGVVKRVWYQDHMDDSLMHSSHSTVGRRKKKTKFVLLKFNDGTTQEMLMRSLKAAVLQAQQAREREAQLFKKIEELGLSPGSTVDLWVPLMADGTVSRIAAPSARHPGDIRCFTVQDARIRWNFGDVSVDFELVRFTADGPEGTPEVLPYNVVKTMLENAEEAHKVLEAKLTRIEAEDAVVEGMEVDLWIEEIGTNIAATVVDLGHEFSNLYVVEIKPTVSYTWKDKTRTKQFFDYDSFMTVWQKGKFVVEQRVKLWEDALANGVREGAVISVWQEPQTDRWQDRKGGSLDAEVKQLKFEFNAVLSDLVLSVLVRYPAQPDDDDKPRLPRGVKKYLAEEWIIWDDLVERLRSTVKISKISCTQLVNVGTADPYVELVIGQTKQKTPYLTDAVNPEWTGLEFEFREGENTNHVKRSNSNVDMTPFFQRELTIKVYDHGIAPKFMGVARFQLSELIPDGQVIKTLTLGPKRPSKNPEDCHFGSVRFVIKACGPGIASSPLQLVETNNTPRFRKKSQDDGRDLFLEAINL
eukprot:INCI11286.1.p1 GENE.INCI11286.1~~INCI11286.1.p1  ORF type:complete len:593 (-),score=110.53 INCI11286.1:1077-2855(-)